MTAPVQPPTEDDKRSALARWREAMFGTTSKSWANQFKPESELLREQAPTDQPKGGK
jgi:hypothetical protein